MADLCAGMFMGVLGLAGGIAVGSGMVALLIVFDLIPRLAQLARAFSKAAVFESAVVGGSVFWTWADFFEWRMRLPVVLALPLPGLLCGIFIGMLAAALTEVMNVLPILAKRLRLTAFLGALVMAMVIGKTAGSLFDWLVYQW
ncbi:MULTISPECIES: stage V sporulation protein AB [unclassified Paenibacillus]|uniref:stage V sporulation protein AB n=1 Tax=unclassified Paenibacillus TaxID=185978 RepID=UPI00095728DE|nr:MULTISPECIES: stage V sporulation protein AB [unclassified Paenibacillus]ASS65073.1 stage V sporulation protein AB [Paenibacillus sp. RUD330]SIQ49637.1 stage V sporulation protein AB [Paenibacillus sp. RU4X]SIQ71506.1 stage V sporulation protein AB [Paenibacillus sp. RU4T]